MNISEKILQLKQDFDDVYEAGKKDQYNEFWDSYQQNGNRVDYIYGFYRLSCEYLHPKYKA